jgi:hypothetical protein
MTTRTLAFALALICTVGAAGSAAPVTVSSRSLEAAFDDGCLVGLRNRLTGESYFGAGDRETLVGLTDRSGLLKAPKLTGRGPVPRGYRWVAQTEGAQPARITTTVTADGDDLLVTQQVERPEGGIGGVEWGWRGLDLGKVRLIIPGVGGVVVDPARTEPQANYEWPGAWQAAAVFAQGKRGGFWLWTDDPQRHFKDLRYQRTGTTATLRFAAETDGPAAGHRRFTSVVWRLAAYRGDWRTPAAQYRALMERSYQLTPLATRKPQWVDRIAFVVTIGNPPERADLERLAREVPADRTLIYFPTWRSFGYDVNYPEYHPGAGVTEWVKMARALGFHVMVHCNFAGVNPLHPLRKQVDSMLLRDRWSGDYVGWYLDRPQDTDHQIMVLDVAYPEARRLLIERVAQAQREVGFDAVHLDFPVLVNSTQGRVGGLNALGGAEVYLRELQAALPRVAIGTEGIHEVLLGCSFAQAGEIFWNQNERLGTFHPVRAYLFSPFVHLYGHLGMPDANTALPAYVDAAVVGLRLDSLPTLPAHDQQIPWDADGVRLALDLGKMWASHGLRADFDLKPGEALAWRGADGFRAALRKDPEGWTLRGPDALPVFMVAEGVNTLAAPWAVAGWPAQDARGVFGLDPARRYLARPSRDPSLPPRLERFAQPLVVQTFYQGAKRLVAQVGHYTRSVWQAADAMGEARPMILVGGKLAPLADGASFSYSSVTAHGELRAGIFAHPPWQGKSVGGATVGEFKIALPKAARLTLRFATGLGDIVHDPNLADKGDGVTFSVLANGERLFSRHHNRDRGWWDAEVDVTRFAGRSIALWLMTDPGPAGDVSFDWACWNNVRIESGAEGKLAFDLVSQAPAVATIPSAAPGATNHYHFEGAGRSLWAALLYEVQPVSLPAKLIDLPFSTATVSSGLGQDRSVYGSGTVSQVEMRGVSMRALGGHPPSEGRTQLEWGLALPGEPCRLRLHYGVRDGGQSVVFLVSVNGETLWQERVPEPAGWAEITVDLSKWAGQQVLLGLITDSDGVNTCDWAQWGEPVLASKSATSSASPQSRLVVSKAEPWHVVLLDQPITQGSAPGARNTACASALGGQPRAPSQARADGTRCRAGTPRVYLIRPPIGLTIVDAQHQ